MGYYTWTEVIASSLQNVWSGIVRFVPSLLGALIVFIVGLIVASGLGKLVEKIFESVRLDMFLGRMGLMPYFERAGVKLRPSYFLGRLVYWFLVVVFLLAVSDSLGLFALSEFLKGILLYIPNIVAAVLIMLAALVIANFARRVISASVMSARLHAGKFLGSLSWWAIAIFGFLAALTQLNVAESIINTLVTGFIGMLALAGGLAFGLGGRDYASHLIQKLKDHTENHAK